MPTRKHKYILEEDIKVCFRTGGGLAWALGRPNFPLPDSFFGSVETATPSEQRPSEAAQRGRQNRYLGLRRSAGRPPHWRKRPNGAAAADFGSLRRSGAAILPAKSVPLAIRV